MDKRVVQAWQNEILAQYVNSLKLPRTVEEMSPLTLIKNRITYYLWRKWWYMAEDWIHRDCDRY